MRREPTPAINPQMYRHFAVVTVLLTVAVAVFANGENEQAAAQTTESQAVTQKPVVAPPKAAQQQQPADTDADDTATWGSDDEEDFGAPTMAAPSSGIWPPFAGDEPDDQSADAAKNVLDGPPPTAAQIAAAEAASRLRSGSPADD